MNEKAAFRFRREWHYAVSHDVELSAHARVLGLVIWDHSDWAKHTVALGLETLRKLTGFTKSTLIKAIDDIATRGHADVIRGSRGRRAPTTFRLVKRSAEPTLFEAADRAEERSGSRTFQNSGKVHQTDLSGATKGPNDDRERSGSRTFKPPGKVRRSDQLLSRESLSSERAPSKRNGQVRGETDWSPGEPLPGEWITEARALLVQHNAPAIDLRLEAGKFVDWHRQNGKRPEDWSAAFRNWIRKAIDFDRGRADRGTETIIDHTGRRVPKMGCA